MCDVESRQWTRLRSGLLIAAAAALVAGAIPLAASAAPAAPPTTSSQALAQYKQLTAKAEQLDEDLLAAKADLKSKQTQLTKLTAQAAAAKTAEAQAKKTESQFQGQVDQFAAASFDGARLSQLSALLTGTSTKDFLTRSEMLDEVAAANGSAMNQLTSAVAKATTAQQQATTAQHQSQAATAAAAKLVSTISSQEKALNSQIATVKAALKKLSAPEKKTLQGNGGDMGTFLGSPGVVNTVLQAALSRRGDEYVWGAAGPSQFDCSGLVMWAYAKGGISLPHSSRLQYTYGKSVARGAWQPGDLLFFGTSASTIHHVAMYVGNGEIIQAPTTGIPVEVVPVSGAGSDYYGSKRIVG
ncbi:MAG TPA: NlpC/P60 family protein [Pseudonocardiaceae bacterium]|jgi:cell wall-associated NlpC family hydrolase|nr:NlpC/P60 family protein [Pseudonocardiaceae bacterium]